jgi:uncharacterized membrane protein YtjA (UPF0391 family)
MTSAHVTDNRIRRESSTTSFISRRQFVKGADSMLYWAFVFLVISIVAAIFGFGGIAAGAATIAKILFGIFIIIFLALLIAGLAVGKALTR